MPQLISKCDMCLKSLESAIVQELTLWQNDIKEIRTLCTDCIAKGKHLMFTADRIVFEYRADPLNVSRLFTAAHKYHEKGLKKETSLMFCAANHTKKKLSPADKRILADIMNPPVPKPLPVKPIVTAGPKKSRAAAAVDKALLALEKAEKELADAKDKYNAASKLEQEAYTALLADPFNMKKKKEYALARKNSYNLYRPFSWFYRENPLEKNVTNAKKYYEMRVRRLEDFNARQLKKLNASVRVTTTNS